MTPLNGGLFAQTQPPAIYSGATRLDLTPMAARILTKLASTPAPVLRSDLIGTGGGVGKSETLRVHICAIRKALPSGLAVEYLPDDGAYRLALA